MTFLSLASSSPRRHQLLAQLGVAFEVLAIDVDEHWNGVEAPTQYTTRLALEKARAGRDLAVTPGAVLGADTAVVLDGRILGKAEDGEAARTMLAVLSGRTHEVFSAVAVVHDVEEVLLSVSRVSFKTLSAAEVAAYCATGEPFGKAGAYAIQGFAAAFIERIEGSYSGVMGLPLFETAALLTRFGVPMGRAQPP